ncbi:MAG: hypothetical protein ACTSRU_19445 [Candidatus Hodarchaeales archaeon]
MISTTEYNQIKRYFKLQDISEEESEDRSHDFVIRVLEGKIQGKVADVVKKYALRSVELGLISILYH